MRIAFRALVLVATYGSSVLASHGCPFLGEDSTRWEQAAHFAKSYELIFEGTVDSIEEAMEHGPGQPLERIHHFQVIRSYRGQATGLLSLRVSGALQTGRTYLVLRGSLIPCPLYLETEKAGTELRFLRGEKPQPEDLITLEEYWLRRSKPHAGRVCGRIHGYPRESLSEQHFRLWFKKEGEWQWDSIWPFAKASVKANGDYCLSGVNPGEYVLTLALYDKEKVNRFVGMTEGSESLESAQPLLVRPNSDTLAPNLFLRKESMFAVRGSVTLSDGRPPNVKKGSILVRLDPVGDSPFDFCCSARPTEDGTFEIRAVPAGDYVLRGWYSARDYAEDGNTLLWEEEAEVEFSLRVDGSLKGVRVVLALKKLD